MRTLKFRAWDKRLKLWVSPNAISITLSGIPMAPDETWMEHNLADLVLMQFTGLLDKNGLTDIYEGDIIDENGVIRGNIYESPQVFREGIDFVIAGMGTSAWRSSESIAMGRGCKYTE